MSIIKSPLRYPGGKSRALKEIEINLPHNFSEFREPFVGGGTVFIYARQKFPQVKVWINDLNFDLFCFWKECQKDIDSLTAEVIRIKKVEKDGRVLFDKMVESGNKNLSDFERAVRFFVLNRITFSGTVDSGGYSEGAFKGRFTNSSIERLSKLKNILNGVKITNLDYKDVLREKGKEVFIFLDPPYMVAAKSRLYGKRGDLHTAFDHEEFAKEIRDCKHKWLITYDDSEEIRKNFEFANIKSWELQYGMNNYKQEKADKGKELFISNYALSEDKAEQMIFPFSQVA